MNSVNPKKSLGQHFLMDESIIRQIADVVPARPGDLVLEIGAGTGMLTDVLLEKFTHVRAVEIDNRAVDFLNERFPDLDLVQDDILKTDWDRLLDHSGEIHIVGNLPYYITSQILFSILDVRDRVTSATMMMQKEVAERLVAVPRTKAYGILSVQVQLMSTPDLLFNVPPDVFHPPPNVMSSVVGLRFNLPVLECSDRNLKTVVRTAFQQRRKKLSNSLKPIGVLPDDPEFDYSARAEAWLPRIYEKLTARLEQLGTLP